MEQVQNSSAASAPFVTVSSTSQPQQLNVNVITQHQNNINNNAAQAFTLSADSYEEVFKEITKKLYGDEQFAELIDASGNIQQANIIYETDAFRTDLGTPGVAFLAAPNGALPPGTIVVQRKICQDKDGRLWSMDGEPVTLVAEQQPVHTTTPTANNSVPTSTSSAASVAPEERWYESEEGLSWTTSKIARYNPVQKVFRCVECDVVGFLSRIAEHWLGNHASLKVFQCPRCPYTSAWARCVRMHLTRQHGENVSVNDNAMWKENPVLEEVTKYLAGLKNTVEARPVEPEGGDRKFICPYCPYTTDRRDLYNRHEREEKPFQCYVCDKQFNRADHVKKHFTRMHRDHEYDINKIKKHYLNKNSQGVLPYSKAKQQQMQKQQQEQQQQQQALVQVQDGMTTSELGQQVDGTTVESDTIALHVDGNGQTVAIPHIAYFNPPSQPGQSGPLQGIQGVGGTKKESKSKGKVKKKMGEKMFTCSYCPWQGVDNWCLKRHLNTHIKPFLCALCDYKAARSERLATHVLKVHNKRVCHKCSFLADDTDSLSQHIQEAHQNPLVKTGFNCNVCQEYFELRADLEAHAILEHQKVIVQCDLCDFRTTDELSMEAHLREKHNLQPGMGAVAAAAAAAQSMANNGGNTFQMQLPTQPQIHLPDPLTLDPQSLLMNATGEPLSQSAMAAVAAVSDAMPPMTFQQDANGTIVPKIEPGLVMHQQLPSGETASTHVGEIQQDNTVGVGPPSVVDTELETLCEKCGIEFVDEASLKLHEKRHFAPDSNDKEQPEKKRVIQRSYICSVCSYTAATRNLMMQHLRAHNGMELVCKAEGCMFSTPFDNTLKEHINAEHSSEPDVRCPHCALKIPTENSFTYHWRIHHKGLCSLCVNLYRNKYGIREIGLQEVISKSMLELLNEDSLERPKPIMQVQQDATNAMDVDEAETLEPTLNVTDQQEEVQEMQPKSMVVNDNQVEEHPVNGETEGEESKFDSSGDQSMDTDITDGINDSVLLNNNNTVLSSDLESEEPARKRIKLDLDFSPIISAMEMIKSRESKMIIPPFTEIQVAPAFSPNQIVSRRKSHLISRAFHPSSRWIHPFSLPSYFRCRRSRIVGKSYKLCRCHHFRCMEKPNPRYFVTKGKLVLHNLRHHGKTPVHECDTCSAKFPFLYQAYLHKLREHLEEHKRDLHTLLKENTAQSNTNNYDPEEVSSAFPDHQREDEESRNQSQKHDYAGVDSVNHYSSSSPNLGP